MTALDRNGPTSQLRDRAGGTAASGEATQLRDRARGTVEQSKPRLLPPGKPLRIGRRKRAEARGPDGTGQPTRAQRCRGCVDVARRGSHGSVTEIERALRDVRGRPTRRANVPDAAADDRLSKKRGEARRAVSRRGSRRGCRCAGDSLRRQGRAGRNRRGAGSLNAVDGST